MLFTIISLKYKWFKSLLGNVLKVSINYTIFFKYKYLSNNFYNYSINI